MTETPKTWKQELGEIKTKIMKAVHAAEDLGTSLKENAPDLLVKAVLPESQGRISAYDSHPRLQAESVSESPTKPSEVRLSVDKATGIDFFKR